MRYQNTVTTRSCHVDIANIDCATHISLEVRQRIEKGESTDSVRSLMISRYGEWVSFEPRAAGGGLILWLTPFLVLLAGMWVARGLFPARASARTGLHLGRVRRRPPARVG